MPRGKDANRRLKYMHVSPKGTMCLTEMAMARVSLPEDHHGLTSIIIPQPQVDKMRENLTEVQITGAHPAVTSPNFLVPKIDSVIPETNETSTSIIVNGEILLKMLKIANEVSTDSEKIMALRIYPKQGVIRLDTYRQPGQQEFLGIIREMEYYGENMPGGEKEGSMKESRPKQKGMMLKTSTGRRFRA